MGCLSCTQFQSRMKSPSLMLLLCSVVLLLSTGSQGHLVLRSQQSHSYPSQSQSQSQSQKPEAGVVVHALGQRRPTYTPSPKRLSFFALLQKLMQAFLYQTPPVLPGPKAASTIRVTQIPKRSADICLWSDHKPGNKSQEVCQIWEKSLSAQYYTSSKSKTSSKYPLKLAI